MLFAGCIFRNDCRKGEFRAPCVFMADNNSAAGKAKIVLATFGTHGDLHPFIALAVALKRRGVAPVIATSEMYRAKIEAEGM